MAEAPTTPQYVDPYKNFKFRIRWDGRYVAGVSKIGPLRRSTEVVRHAEGGEAMANSHKSPGRTEYDAITLERGITQDTAFEQWASQVWKFGSNGGAGTPTAFRKDLAIEVFDEAGSLVLRYLLYRCWVSEYQALPDLDANANAIALEHIKVETEGWERDPSVGR